MCWSGVRGRHTIVSRAIASISHTIVGGFLKCFAGCGRRAWREANVNPSLAVFVLLQYLHSQLCKQIYQFYNKFQFQLYFFSQYFYNYYYCYKFGRITIENWCNGFFYWIGLYTWNLCISYFSLFFFIAELNSYFLIRILIFAIASITSNLNFFAWTFTVHLSTNGKWEVGWLGETLDGAVWRGKTIDDGLCNAIIAFTYHRDRAVNILAIEDVAWNGRVDVEERHRTEQNNG